MTGKPLTPVLASEFRLSAHLLHLHTMPSRTWPEPLFPVREEQTTPVPACNSDFRISGFGLRLHAQCASIRVARFLIHSSLVVVGSQVLSALISPIRLTLLKVPVADRFIG